MNVDNIPYMEHMGMGSMGNEASDFAEFLSYSGGPVSHGGWDVPAKTCGAT